MNKFKDGISVVVPTYNSADLLRLTLDSLSQQSFDKDFFEVIVADDGSSDNTKSVVNEYLHVLNIRYKYQEDLGFRVAAARNLGLFDAKYSITLFLDTGMIAAPDLLMKHYKKHSSKMGISVIGLSFGLEEFSEVNGGLLERLCNQYTGDRLFKELYKHKDLFDCRYDFMRQKNFNIQDAAFPWVIFWTGHVSCKTTHLFDIGGFDETFSSWGGEDVEIAIRLHERNVEFFVFDELLTINYPHQRNDQEKISTSRKNIEYIIRKHSGIEGVELLHNLGWTEIISQSHVREVMA